MTPADQLRSLVKEATPGQIEAWLTNVRQGVYMPEVAGIVPESVSVSLARIGEYAALAPQLAELVADMADALDWVEAQAFEAHVTWISDYARDALAGLAALFPEDSA